MARTDIKLLFFRGEIDFEYLRPQLESSDYDVSFTNDHDEFINYCHATKFDSIIVSSVGASSIPNQILSCLTKTKNIYTPVIIIAGKDDNDLMKQSAKHQFDFIIFPFTHDELMIRIDAGIRKKDTELTIHSSLLTFRNIFETLPVGLLQTDERGNFLRFNNELLRILDMEGSEFNGINFFQLCHPDDYLIERQHLDRMLRKETDMAKFEIRLINNDGKTSVCKVSARTKWKNDFV